LKLPTLAHIPRVATLFLLLPWQLSGAFSRKFTGAQFPAFFEAYFALFFGQKS